MEYNVIHAPLNYHGGKSKIIGYLKNLFPDNINNFVDLFCGGLNVSINIQANHIYANDLFTEVIDIYKMIKSYDDFDKLNNDIYSIIDTYKPFTPEGYYKLREDYNKDHNTLKLLVLIFHAFTNLIRFNKKNKFNASFTDDRKYNSSKKD